MIALLGGTFDPVHVGHLAAAKAARRLLGIDTVRLVVAADPYHKRDHKRDHKRSNAVISAARHRLTMVQLACESSEGLVADASDLGRAGPSYTIDLLEWRTETHRAERRVWIIGDDAFAQILSWRRVEEVFRLTSFLVFARRDHRSDWSAELEHFVRLRRVRALSCENHGEVMLSDETLPVVSSTMIRDCLRRAECVDQWLPPTVLNYIKENHLYEESREAS